jgi:hypothetical protein
MRTCSLHRRACARACFSHRRAHERACSPGRRALEHACHTHRRAHKRACSPYRRALMRACLHHRRAPKARLIFLPTRTHARFFSVQACTHARLPLSRPRMWAHPLPKKPPKTPVRPPVPTLPKNWKPIAMQDVQTTNLKLARRETDASCSRNHSISSGSALKLTVAAGTNEVAMWALQLYIGFLPNFHSPFREPTASIFRTVFSHGISVPPPTSWLSLGHFSS